MHKKLIILSLLILIAISFTGCITGPGGIAPSTMPITANDSYTIIERNVSGTDTAINIMGFIPIMTCTAYKALQNAKEENGADALINVTGYNKSLTLIFVNLQWMIISGDAIKFQRSGADIE